MKKRTLPIVVLLLVACAMCFAACKLQTTVNKLKMSISVDTQNAKTEYLIGEELSFDGLKVVAKFFTVDGVTTDEVTVPTGDCQFNTVSYNNRQAGSYKIKVSYTYDGETSESTYTVTVVEREYDGISVELAEGVEDTYHLTEPVTIDTNAVTVKTTDAYGNLLDGEVEGYTTSLYKGKTEIALTDGKAEITESGAYQIWVEKESETQMLYTLKAFVTIYVLDDVKTLEFNEDAEDTLLTQEKGDDVMTETWSFTVTYESGKTKNVSAKDVKFSQKVDTDTVGKDIETVATYTEYNAKSQKVTTTGATVKYTVTEHKEEGEKTVFVNASDLTAGDITEETKIGDGVYLIATSGKKITVDASKKTYEGLSFTNRIKLNGSGKITERSIKIVAEGPGTATVYAITGSSSDLTRTLAFADATGNVIQKSDGLPNAITKVTFKIPSAGTYYIYSANSGINIYGIEVKITLPKTVFINASDLTAGEIAEETKIGDGIYIIATSSKKVVIDTTSSKTYDKLTFTQRIKLGGAGSVTERSVKIVADGAGTVTIYAITSSSSDLTRKAVFADTTGKVIKESEGLPNAVTKVTFEIPEAGTYYVYGSAAINLYGIEVITTASQKAADTYNFNLTALVEEMTKQIGSAPADKAQLASGYFKGDNAFMSVTIDGTSDVYRTSGGGCIEIKKGTVKVTFKGTGTLSVSFASTGGSNNSRLALLDSEGKIVAAKDKGGATLVETGDDTGAYEITGTKYVTVTFEITNPGTYTICSMYGTTGRGMRISAISMTDNH